MERSRLENELRPQLIEACWRDLRSQLGRDALILVAPELELLDVGVAIAADRTDAVSTWINAGQLNKPNLEQISLWESQKDKRFSMLILQPHILIQELLQ